MYWCLCSRTFAVAAVVYPKFCKCFQHFIDGRSLHILFRNRLVYSSFTLNLIQYNIRLEYLQYCEIVGRPYEKAITPTITNLEFQISRIFSYDANVFTYNHFMLSVVTNRLMQLPLSTSNLEL